MESTDLAIGEMHPPAPGPNHFAELRATVLNGVVSEPSKRNYTSRRTLLAEQRSLDAHGTLDAAYLGSSDITQYGV